MDDSAINSPSMERCIQKSETLNALILYLVASHIFNEVCMTSHTKKHNSIMDIRFTLLKKNYA